MEKVRTAIIGCGVIAPAYIAGCRNFEILELVACADIVADRAEGIGAEHDLGAQSVEELLANPQIELVINLTVPSAHAEVSLAAIRAGKHVYSEKPLALTRHEGHQILQAAAARKVRLGCAPDTVLGGGLQTARKLIDDGWIGSPVAATAFMTNRGPESWHPNPFFFYQQGAGPLFDIGPYYLSALVNFLGPVHRVASMARISFPERIATSQAQFGKMIPVEVPTHLSASLEFASGLLGTLILSFDVWHSNLPRIEIYGSEGSLSVPDPNIFGGQVRVRRAGSEAWREFPLTHSDEVGRGIGVADLAYALRTGRHQRASGQLAYHVLDVMQALAESAERGTSVEITSRCDRPEPLPMDLLPGRLD